MIEQQSFSSDNAKLYLVPTPIGNISDISPRAIEILGDVDLIAAEDTRHSGLLLSRLGIKTQLTSLHEHNYASKVPQLIEDLKSGLSVAQISDAGTPSISDPGHELVVAAIENDIDVVSIPGPMAGITALIASGLTVQPFSFIGFLSRKKNEQLRQFETFQLLPQTYIFYESPQRIIDTLKNVKEFFGNKIRVVAARELTKKFESYVRGSVTELLDFFLEYEPRGEFVLMIEVPKKEVEIIDDVRAIELVSDLVEDGLKATQAIKKVSKEFNLDRNRLYDLYNKNN
ncbi:MAG: 16S rRNA (cytidine(1402)-2'-O)-methyltransferase, partial [Lactobacillaceae bacterium]|nr:16S rRNA (cytidine(1402)-2'-O)-methyltransferase [Lactobacillaceae bacterium]